MTPASSELERVFREVSGQAVATLVRVFGDIDLAEDAVQDAFIVASTRWSADGIPPNPAGWIVTTARRRAIDQIRRTKRGNELQRVAAAAELPPQVDEVDGATTDDSMSAAHLVDDQLRLMFTCCHPAIRPEHQIALTLRLVAGLAVPDIARAFLVTEAAMARRLGRAKYKIKAAGVPYRQPGPDDLPARLHSVLSVLLLIYNAGTDDLENGRPIRAEGIRLARATHRLLPEQNEAAGLLALVLLNEARVPARLVEGNSLRDQDRSRWDRALIDEGHGIVRSCVAADRPGTFQLQAAIQAVHCHAPTFEATDWHSIVTLYDQLLAAHPSPVVALNRAIAHAEVDGPETGLADIEPLEPALAGYHSWHAARAAFLRDLGRFDDAASAFRRATELSTSVRERAFFRSELERLEVVRGQ